MKVDALFRQKTNYQWSDSFACYLKNDWRRGFIFLASGASDIEKGSECAIRMKRKKAKNRKFDLKWVISSANNSDIFLSILVRWRLFSASFNYFTSHFSLLQTFNLILIPGRFIHFSKIPFQKFFKFGNLHLNWFADSSNLRHKYSTTVESWSAWYLLEFINCTDNFVIRRPFQSSAP